MIVKIVIYNSQTMINHFLDFIATKTLRGFVKNVLKKSKK